MTHRVLLVKQLEGAFLCLVACGNQMLQSLLASRHLPATHNTTVLVHHQVGLGQTTCGVLGRAMENLCLGAGGEHGGAAHLDVVATSVCAAAHILAILTCVGRHILPEEHIFFRGSQGPPRYTGTGKDFRLQPCLNGFLDRTRIQRTGAFECQF